MKCNRSSHNPCRFTKVIFPTFHEGVGEAFTVARSVLWYLSILTCVGNGTEVGRPDVQFGKVATSQELTSAAIFSFQFCSQKAVTENKSHCFLLCRTENVARHLHVGGRESSQVVQAASPGWAGVLRVQPSKRGALLIPFLTLASLKKVSSL